MEDPRFQDAFPCLQRLCIGGIIAWDRVSSSGTVRWRPSVLDKTHLARMLKGYADGVVRDVNGCITNAFEPGEFNAGVLRRRGLGA